MIRSRRARTAPALRTVAVAIASGLPAVSPSRAPVGPDGGDGTRWDHDDGGHADGGNAHITCS